MKALETFVLTGYGEPIVIEAGAELDPAQFEPDVVSDLQARGLVENPDAPEPPKPAKKSK